MDVADRTELEAEPDPDGAAAAAHSWIHPEPDAFRDALKEPLV